MKLREVAYRANRRLAESGLVLGTFGNVSAVDISVGAVLAVGEPGTVIRADASEFGDARLHSAPCARVAAAARIEDYGRRAFTFAVSAELVAADIDPRVGLRSIAGHRQKGEDGQKHGESESLSSDAGNHR